MDSLRGFYFNHLPSNFDIKILLSNKCLRIRTHTSLERNQTKLLMLHKDKLANEKQAFPKPLLYDYSRLT